jgi:hypothetical protein
VGGVAVNRPLLALLSVSLLTALLSGCLADSAGSVADADPTAAGAPKGAEAGSAATHGQAKRADGPISVEPEGSQFVAKRTVTVANDFGGAAASKVSLDSFNGAVSVQASRDGGYQFKADLYGRGATEDQARQALDRLTLDASDDLAAGILTLSFALKSAPLASGGPLPLPVTLGASSNNGGSFALVVPPQPSHDLTVDSSNGRLTVDGLHGPSLKASTSNGGVTVGGAFGTLDADTSNGGINLAGTFNDVQADSSNGGIDADLRFTRGGKVDLSTSNGGIDVRVPASGAAYDVTGDTSNGDVEIRLGGSHIDSDDHATYRSPGWETASVQVTIGLSSSNAGITVED